MPNLTNPEMIPGFDAVAESRKWKEAVGRETAGMDIPERMAYFRRHSSVEAFRRQVTPEVTDSCLLHEDPPET